MTTWREIRCEALTPYADILKVDFERTTVEERAALVKRHQSPNCMMLAEKVETHEQFVAAREMGYVYFQGYFCRRPEVLKAKEIPVNRVNYLRMLEAISRGTGCSGTGESDQERGVSAVPVAALPEFTDVRLQERDSFGAACSYDTGRARDAALDPAGDAGFGGHAEIDGTWCCRRWFELVFVNCSRPRFRVRPAIRSCWG